MSPSCLRVRMQVDNPEFVASQGPLLCMVPILLPKCCQETPHWRMIVFTAFGLTVNISVMPEWGHTTVSLKWVI